MTRRELIQELIAIPFGDLDTEVEILESHGAYADIERLTFDITRNMIRIESVEDFARKYYESK